MNPADSGFLSAGNRAYLESVHADPAADNRALRDAVAAAAEDKPCAPAVGKPPDWRQSTRHKQAQVSRLISAYRALGHLLADIDPLGVMPRGDAREIELRRFDLGDADLDTEFDVGDFAHGGRRSLREILANLRQIYCGPVGFEISHLTDMEQREWLLTRIESADLRPQLTAAERVGLLQKLTAAEGLEKYLHKKYVGQKRFSLEGGEVLIPTLSHMIQQFGAAGVREIVVGMAHRGRLNVLVNLLGKSPAELFNEFEGRYELQTGGLATGDVKYHQGASSDIQTPGGVVHLALSFNPSHLEIIDPVVQGSVRARQQRRGDLARRQVVPILIHGDAAFAGQGVVMETLNMSRTRGYSVGGTLHIIVNNQIGFTTNTLDARSTLYCTEVAKMVQAPIFHVHGDDPEAARRAAQLALEYRLEFGGDAIVDLVCYRRHGHNEADEPGITQPMMYKLIRARPTPRQIYADRLIAAAVINAEQAAAMAEEYRRQLDDGHVVAGQIMDPNKAAKMVDWQPYLGDRWDDGTATAVPAEELARLARALAKVPADFAVHPRVQKILDARLAMADGRQSVDWGGAELLAYAAILQDGYDVRLSGQDTARGTFSHRHAALHDQSRSRVHIPLQHLAEHMDAAHTASPPAKKFGEYLVINSFLSEEAVLGFEYGYATTEPRALVIWEAQFGDFVNGAQVVIDQFISSGQAKWARVCGLTLFLPHGFEGQGPEHSSARLERFLQLCAEQNMQVCIPTTPAQMFHLLRRQILRPLRRPLVVMTPKSLLRHKLSVSKLAELTAGKFHPVLGEADELSRPCRRLILCSGKIYYDLLAARRERSLADIAIARIEQLQPWPARDLEVEFERYAAAADIVWCQEEPENQGAWPQVAPLLRAHLKPAQRLRYIGRAASPSPAVGYYKLHIAQQRAIVDQALATVAEN